jgi:hypothetical protein
MPYYHLAENTILPWLGEWVTIALSATGNTSIKQSVISQSGNGQTDNVAWMLIVCLALVGGTWLPVARAPFTSPPIEKISFLVYAYCVGDE